MNCQDSIYKIDFIRLRDRKYGAVRRGFGMEKLFFEKCLPSIMCPKKMFGLLEKSCCRDFANIDNT